MSQWTTDLRSVPEQISKLMAEYPHSVALSFEAQRLSYEELGRQAGRLGGYLTQLGIPPGATVAICMERSFDWVIAALATLRIGAAYVPLDPSWPDARLQYAVKDSGAVTLVAQKVLFDRLGIQILGIDVGHDAQVIAAAPELNWVPVRPDSLAYVIYTSGSTGAPKGVEITHGSLAQLVRWHLQAFQVGPRDRASHLAGLGFDAAVWEIWPNLCAGAALCLVDEAIRLSSELLQEWILSERVTISFVPTVHAAPMMLMQWPETTSLRILLTGGDTLHQMPPAGLPFQVINNYGPTECTVVATSTILKPGSAGTPSIGRPIGPTTVYVLGSDLQPILDETIGELFIGGEGVARGYRNLSEATESSFFPDPFSPVPHARMYKTGDRGKWRADGELEFSGRLDRQVKIRGYRISLDEIDSALNAQSGIEFGTTVVRKAFRREEELVAYVLPSKSCNTPDVDELQSGLLRVLPEYMVPSNFVCLESLPLSSNGKIDLHLLPSPSEKNVLERSRAKAPVSSTEKQLLTIVRKLLEQPTITVEDNFFLAGGHSLLSMQLFIQLRTAFGVDLNLKELYQGPTVASLTSVVDQKMAEKHLTTVWQELLNAQDIGLRTSFFDIGGTQELLRKLQQKILYDFGKVVTPEELTENSTIYQQARLIHSREEPVRDLPAGVLPLRMQRTRNQIFWVHYLSANLARAMAEDQAFMHLELAAEDTQRLGQMPSLHEIAECFVRKIVATKQVSPYIIGGFCLGGILAYEISSQLQALGHEISLLVMLDTPSPSYFEMQNILTPRLRHPLYLLKRATRIGLLATFKKIRRRLTIYLRVLLNAPPKLTGLERVQRMVEIAAGSYEARKYYGKVALILAADHPPHIDFLPEWRRLVPHNLHSQYLMVHHSELMSNAVIQSVANAMAVQIKHAEENDVETPTTEAQRPIEIRAKEVEILA